jgi:hypothetical protein
MTTREHWIEPTSTNHLYSLMLTLDIQAGAQDELLSLEIPVDAGVVCRPVLTPAADNPPSHWRTVFTTGYFVPEFQWIPDTVVARGGGVRVVSALPTKPLIADRTIALLPLDQPGAGGVVLFRSETVIGTLTALFETIWEQSTSYPTATARRHPDAVRATRTHLPRRRAQGRRHRRVHACLDPYRAPSRRLDPRQTRCQHPLRSGHPSGEARLGVTSGGGQTPECLTGLGLWRHEWVPVHVL